MNRTKRGSTKTFVAIGILAWLAASNAGAEQVAAIDKERGYIACGVGRGTVGFSHPDAAGNWRGLSADMCRAVAVALFGDTRKVRFVPLDVSRQYASLSSGEIDVLAANPLLTLRSDTIADVSFAAVYHYDRLGFLVARVPGGRSADMLTDSAVCMENDSAVETAVSDHFRAGGKTFRPMVFDRSDDMRRAFFAGRCNVLAAPVAVLHATRTAYAPNPSTYVILPQTFGKAPLALAVRRDDRRLAAAVRQAVHTMIEAEELGINSQNVGALLRARDPAVDRLFRGGDTAYEIVKQVGNYGEVYDRSLGRLSLLGIERGLNQLSSNGGMLYAPLLPPAPRTVTDDDNRRLRSAETRPSHEKALVLDGSRRVASPLPQ